MDRQYTIRLEKIEAAIHRRLSEHPDGAWTREVFGNTVTQPPADLVQTLSEPGRELVSRGGKRWRPLFMALTCEALGGGDAAVPLTPLVEFPHNASLIHDDIEDNSLERRGKPAVHVMYGVDTAINSGSFMYFLGLACLDGWNAADDRKNLVYRSWGEQLRRLHLGQAMDIAWHRNFSSLPTIEEYDLMCRLKTGVLARLSAMLGVYAAGTGKVSNEEKEMAETLGRVAEDLGVGFQILDDVKNLTGGIRGKRRGDDIVEGKKSLPVILYLNQRSNRVEFVKRCFSASRAGGTGATEVEELIGELDRAGTIEEARMRGTELVAGAAAAVRGEAFPGGAADEGARELLAGLAELIG
jgi:geranylgeranyl pyrophosphate synthase